MYYVICCTNAPDSLEKRRSVRPAHLARLKELQQQNRLLTAGPLLGKDLPQGSKNLLLAGISGSLIIADFESLELATAWAAADPYATAGVYANIEVTPFIEADLSDD